MANMPIYIQIKPKNIQTLFALLEPESDIVNAHNLNDFWVCWPNGAIGREPYKVIEKPSFPICIVNLDYVEKEYETVKAEEKEKASKIINDMVEDQTFYQVIWKANPRDRTSPYRDDYPSAPGFYFRSIDEAIDFLTADAEERTILLESISDNTPIILGHLEKRVFGMDTMTPQIIARQTYYSFKGRPYKIEVVFDTVQNHPNKVKKSFDLRSHIYDSYGDAAQTLNILTMFIIRNGCASFADLRFILKKPVGSPLENYIGWKSMDRAKIRKLDTGYVIEFPLHEVGIKPKSIS